MQEAINRYGKPGIFNTDQGCQFTVSAPKTPALLFDVNFSMLLPLTHPCSALLRAFGMAIFVQVCIPQIDVESLKLTIEGGCVPCPLRRRRRDQIHPRRDRLPQDPEGLVPAHRRVEPHE